MASGRLTNNSDEAEISKLLSGDSIFSIPYFQRPYKWKPVRLEQLQKDILRLVDEEDDCHFLGAIIVHGRKTPPSEPKLYDVIDGQQRLTTIYLYLCATIKVLCELNEHSEAAGLFLKYIVINREIKTASNIRLHSSKEDRKQLEYVINDLLTDGKFVAAIGGGFKPKFLPSVETVQKTIKTNYKLGIKFLKNEVEQGGGQRLRKIYESMLDSMSVVQIDIFDPTNGPKIFDSLNSRQEPMTIGDLVRNEIFAKIADQQPADVEHIDEQHWQPFYKKFQEDGGKNLFDAYFFPYGLIQNPNLKKSQIYDFLRGQWTEIKKPEEIICKLSDYQNAFIDLNLGTNRQNHLKTVQAQFHNLYLLGSPGSTYPFLMQLSKALITGNVNENDGLEILNALESFLVRRAICGYEPTGLHAVFKKLWIDCDSKPTKDAVINAISKHKTVSWPDETAVRKAITTRPLYGAGIVRYLIIEWDRNYGGDVVENDFWIEHVLPQVHVEKHWAIFSKKEHESKRDLLANLLPLSKEMNQELQNGPYADKKKRYQSDSKYKSAREFANKYSDWTPEALEKRTGELADWAVNRWGL